MGIAEKYENKKDEELVKMTLRDKANFSYLIERYEGRLMRYVRRITNVTNEEAEDILQDSFIKAYYNLNDFDQNLKFSSWIYRITRNQVISNFRKNKVRPQGNYTNISDEELHNIASGLNIEKEIDATITKKKVKEVLSQLEDKYRDILVLKFLEGKNYQEMSDIIKKPKGTVATLISRGKERFKKELSSQNVKL